MLKNPQDIFEAILQDFPTAMILIDEEGTIILVNSETESLFGYSSNEMLGLTIEKLVPERFSGSHIEQRKTYNILPETRLMGVGREVLGLRKNGKEFPVEVGLRSLKTTQGNFILCAIIDISARKAVEDKIAELELMKSSFFKNISHEFKTPLTLILGPLQEIIKKTNNTEIIDNISIINNNANRLAGLINQLLDISGLNFGTIKLQVKKGNLENVINNLVALFMPVALHKKLKLETYYLGLPDDLYFDRLIIEKIMSSLLTGLINGSPEDSTITISVANRSGNSSNSETEINITNPGCSIPDEALQDIIRNFYSASFKQYGDIGREIALGKELIRYHKGSFNIQSRDEGGTIIKILIPFKKEKYFPNELAEDIQEPQDHLEVAVKALTGSISGRESSKTDGTEHPADENKRLVLVVEDSSDMMFYITTLLKPYYNLAVAENGQEGIEKAIDLLPDIIVSDVMMPHVDGYELCKKIKSDEKSCHIPIILLTAMAEMNDKIKGLEFGADDYLMKPFNANELLVRVKNLLQGRDLLRERFREMVVIKPSEITSNSVDEMFLQKIMKIIEENITDCNFGVNELAKGIFLSQSQLYRKLLALTGYSASAFIQVVRLKRAAEMLIKKAGNITDIAYEVGFNSTAYFTKCFKEHFGCTPSKYINN